MKSHDFGQFLFNSSILNRQQIFEVIKSSRKSEPSLAVESLFLRLVFASELISDDDNFIRTLITPRQEARAAELKSGQSLWTAQGLIDNGIANYLKLERIFDEYNKLEIPSLESALTDYYEHFKTNSTVDFPFTVDIINMLHAFLSETLKAAVIILPQESFNEKLVGASVKIVGEIPAVIAIVASENIFLKMAQRYESYVENLEDANDAISELLNVLTGQFTVKIAASRGIDEEPEPPRVGFISENFQAFSFLSDIGHFYVYVGKDELF